MPQPIDPHTELARATAAERIQQIADRVSLAAQARVAAEVANARVNAEQQVREAEQKRAEVERELRRRNPFQGRRRRREPGDGETGDERQRIFYTAAEKPVIADDDSAHHFDVEI